VNHLDSFCCGLADGRLPDWSVAQSEFSQGSLRSVGRDCTEGRRIGRQDGSASLGLQQEQS
jgi:hypothetical protein